MPYRPVAPLDLLKQRDLLNRRAKRALRSARHVEALEPRRLYAAGDLDPTFNGGQIKDVSLGGLSLVHRIAAQPDGKLLVVGPSHDKFPPRSFAAYRFNADGTPDATFGVGGVAAYIGPNDITDANDITVLPNGKILVTGQTFTADDGGLNDDDFFVARLNANGTLDTSFGTGGMVATNVSGPDSYDSPDSIVALPDGRFYVGGTSSNDYAVVRYNANGSLDTSFAGDGIAVVSGRPFTAEFAVMADGKVVLAAVDEHVTGGGTQVVRLTSAGVLDTSFSGDGRQYLQGFFAFDIAAVGERLVLYGGAETPPGSVRGISLLRLRHDGGKDTGFGPGGLRTFVPPGTDDVRFEDMAVQADGKFLVTGMMRKPGITDFDAYVARLTAGGQIDTTFSGDGLFIMDKSSSTESFRPVTPLPDGRIMVGGYSGSIVPVMARLLGESTPTTGATIAIEGGVLVARGTDGADEMFVRRVGADQVSIEIRYGTGQSTTAVFDMDAITGVRLEGLGGNDTFNLIDALVAPVVRNTTVLGGSGDDTTSYATRTTNLGFSVQLPASRMTSGAQTDVLDHVETIIGGSGNDTFAYGDNPFLPEEEENVTISYRLEGRGGNDRFVTSWISTENVQGVTLYGGDGADRFEQGDLGGRVFGEGGDDTIVMIRESYYAGNIDGGAGTDLAVWGSMIGRAVLDLRDYVSVENANVTGGRTVIGTEAANHIETVAGTDEVTIQGLGGSDTLIGGDRNDSLVGGAGDDSLIGGAGDDTMDGGAGTDTLRGDAGTDTLLNGEVTDDALPGVTLANGVLSFIGTVADESVSIWRNGASLVLWLDGVTASYDYASVTRIELSGNVGNDYLKLHQALNIPALLIGGFGDDRLIGGSNKDTLLGGDGDDHLTGNGGDDWIDGGVGSDILRGGNGRDTLDYSSRVNRLIVGLDALQDDGEAGENDLALDDIERLIGGGANDKLGGGSAVRDQAIYGGPGNDTIYGGGGKDALFGEGGNDKLGGGDGDDYIEAGAGHDAVYGDGGADTLLGLAGNDRLFSGGDGASDSVIGGLGTDSSDADEIDVVSSVESSLSGVPIVATR